MITPSTPRPRDERVGGGQHAVGPASTTSAPKPSASSRRSGSKSMPSTRHPWARSSCTVSRPIRPSPVTTTARRAWAAARRMPCRAMLPMRGERRVVAATPVGHLARIRLAGTATTSACGPFEATRSPDRERRSRRTRPRPLADVPVAERHRLLELGADRVDRRPRPSVRALSSTSPHPVGLLPRLVEQSPGRSRPASARCRRRRPRRATGRPGARPRPGAGPSTNLATPSSKPCWRNRIPHHRVSTDPTASLQPEDASRLQAPPRSQRPCGATLPCRSAMEADLQWSSRLDRRVQLHR